jgi:hypothetical protein
MGDRLYYWNPFFKLAVTLFYRVGSTWFKACSLCLTSRVGEAEYYNLLWAVFVQHRKRPHSTFGQTKTRDRSQPKLAKLITSAGSSRVSKFIEVGLGVVSPHMADVVGWRNFFLVVSQIHAQPKPADVVGSEGVPFRGFTKRQHPRGSFPLNPQSGGRNI